MSDCKPLGGPGEPDVQRCDTLPSTAGAGQVGPQTVTAKGWPGEYGLLQGGNGGLGKAVGCNATGAGTNAKDAGNPPCPSYTEWSCGPGSGLNGKKPKGESGGTGPQGGDAEATGGRGGDSLLRGGDGGLGDATAGRGAPGGRGGKGEDAYDWSCGDGGDGGDSGDGGYGGKATGNGGDGGDGTSNYGVGGQGGQGSASSPGGAPPGRPVGSGGKASHWWYFQHAPVRCELTIKQVPVTPWTPTDGSPGAPGNPGLPGPTYQNPGLNGNGGGL